MTTLAPCPECRGLAPIDDNLVDCPRCGLVEWRAVLGPRQELIIDRSYRRGGPVAAGGQPPRRRPV